MVFIQSTTNEFQIMLKRSITRREKKSISSEKRTSEKE